MDLLCGSRQPVDDEVFSVEPPQSPEAKFIADAWEPTNNIHLNTLALIHLGGSGFGSDDSSCGDGCGDGGVGSRCVLLEELQLVPASHHQIEPLFQKSPESYLDISRDCQIALVVLLIHNAKRVLDFVIYNLPF